MADKKISALTASSTPLAGTEVLPIVQSGATVKVAVSDLTAGRSFNALGMTLTSTDASATAAPLLDLYRDSASPAASDTLGEIEFNGEDSAGNKQTYGVIHGSILSPTSTAEQGQLHFETATAGVLTEKMIIGTTNLVINEPGGIFNVRIEGDTDANLFYTDATNSRVGVGTISPAEKLDVVGKIKLSDNLVIGTTAKGLTTGSSIPLGLGTNNTVTAVTIDTSGNVGVGAAPNATSGRNVTVNSVESSIALISTGAKSYSIASGANFQYTGSALSFIDNTAPATRMLITTDGELWVANLADQGAYNLQVGGTGVWGAGAYVNGSDSRLKEEVAPIEPCLDIVNTLNPVTFRYKEDYSKDQSVQPGFIAQELLTALEGQNYVGGVVHEGPEYYNVAYQSLIPVLVKAVQELSARVKQLEAK